MSNLASVLKQEIARIARKEVKAASEPARKKSAKMRQEIDGLKKRVKELESRLANSQPANADIMPAGLETPTMLRFSPKSIRTHRKRLGFSAQNYALLLGVSMQTIYHWEQGKSLPRQSQLQRLAAVRRLGKREATKRLGSISAERKSGSSSKNDKSKGQGKRKRTAANKK